MKILLINSPVRLGAAPTCIPTGLAQIASHLRNNGFTDVGLLDINGLRLDIEEALQHITDSGPDVIGISGLITTYRFQKDLVGRLRKSGFKGTIISGGGCATSVSEYMRKSADIDIFAIGEGEHTMLELAIALRDKTALSEVAGIVYKDATEYIATSPRTNDNNLDLLPFPAYDLLPVDNYAVNNIWGDKKAKNKYEGFDKYEVKRDMNVISSRGCPFSCNYCYHLFGRGKYRFRSAENIIEEVNLLKDKYDIDFISFVDDNMLTNKNRMVEFCALMESTGVKWACLGRVDDITNEYVKRLKGAGCLGIGFGFESGSLAILKNMDKKATLEQGIKAVDVIRNNDIYANGTFILGYPGENWETVKETKAFCEKIEIQQHFFFATPYPGTTLWDIARLKIDDEDAFIERLGDADEFLINLSELSDDELFEAKRFLEAASAGNSDK